MTKQYIPGWAVLFGTASHRCLAWDTDYRYLGARNGLLRAMGICNASTWHPWLASTDTSTNEWALRTWDDPVITSWNVGYFTRIFVYSCSVLIILIISRGALYLQFFHIPKAAGTSLTKVLVASAIQHGLDVCNGHGNAEHECLDATIRSSTTSAASEARPNLFVHGHQYQGLSDAARSPREVKTGLSRQAFVTILRHPIARVVSLYDYIRWSKHHHAHAAVINMTLLAFLESPYHGGEASNEMVRMFCGPRHGPKAERCSNDGPFAVAEARRHLLLNFAAVGLQECYPESTKVLESVIPWADKLPVASANRAADNKDLGFTKNNNSYEEPQLTQAELAAVAALNTWDLELFEFGVRLFRARLVGLTRAAHGHSTQNSARSGRLKRKFPNAGGASP